MKKRILSILLTFAMILSIVPVGAFTLSASAETDDDYEYTVLDDSTAEITGYSGSATELEIPSEIDGYTVTSIGNSAFYDCSSLTSITIPSGVTSISDSAFKYCSNLTSITIPDSVTSIGNEAFFGCTSFTSITIPSGVTSIGNEAFFDCSSLTSIAIPSGVTSIGDGAFEGCTSLTIITIPSGVTSIGDGAFEGCTSLTSITIPSGVTSIGEDAFRYCTSLTSITIPDSVTSIGSSAFHGCSKLTSITIPDSVTSIGDDAFFLCESLTSINVSENNSVYTSVDGVLFNKKKTEIIACPEGKQGKYVIPSGVTSIGDGAFSYCTSLTSITIPSGVTSIGFYAFYDCTSLTNITIPSSVTSIGKEAFYNTGYYNDESNWENDVLYIGNHLIGAESSITSCAIKQGTKTIADYAFYYCESLTSITIPDSVTSIADRTFYNTGYYNDESNWENDVLYIGNHLIEAETSITSCTIKQGTKTIADCAFMRCESLTSITIPDSVISIGSSAFCDCTSLTSITILSSVTSIGDWAFGGCSSLEDVYYSGSESDRSNMDIGDRNESLTSATWHYNFCFHIEEIIKGKAATCTATGLTAGVKCSVCEKTLTKQETIPALGHKNVTLAAVKATCTTAGKTAGTKCSVCGRVTKAQTTVKALGHKSNAGVVTKAATYDATGVKTYTCTVCKKVIKTETIAKLAKTSLKKATITVKDQTYSGKAKTPSITVKLNGKTLTKNTDYTVSYKNNKSIGKATVTIKGIKAYKDSASKTFKINPKKVTDLKLKSSKKKELTVSWKKDTKVSGYEIVYATNSKLTKGKKTVKVTSYKTYKKTIKKLTSKKTYYVKVRSYKTVSGKKYYSAYTSVKKLKIK